MNLRSFVRIIILVLFIITGLQSHAQTIDSLLNLYNKSNQDTTKVRLLLNVGEQIYLQNPDSADKTWNLCLKKCEVALKKNDLSNNYRSVYNKLFGYTYINLAMVRFMLGKVDEAFILNNKSISILIKINDEQGIGNAYSNMSQFYYNTGSMDSAVYYAEKSLKLFKKIKSLALTSIVLNNLGLFYDMKGEYSKALDYYHESLKIQEQIKDKRGIAYVYHNIGGIYKSQNELDKALEYYEKSLKLRKENNDQFGIAESLINIGTIKRIKGDHKTALELYNNALSIQKAINDINGMAVTYNNIGNLYNYMGDLKNATEYLMKSMEIQEKIGDKLGLSYSYNNLSAINEKLKNYDKAISFSLKSMQISKELGFPENIKMAAFQLYTIYSKKGNHQLALENYKLFIKMRDSLSNIETQKSLIKQQTNFEYQQKKAIADAEHKAEIKKREELASIEKNKQNVIIASVSLVLILVIVFSSFLYNRFKITQKQKHIIELKEKETNQQKLIIEEKHKEITDSINYAERIQRSFLATKEQLDANLNDYFVFFKPKDVVSGDFYWASKLKNEDFALVTADSTGHGVPGAIMSILNTSSLEKAVELGNTEPAEILNITRQIIIERLKKDGSTDGGKDGMDCSLICFNPLKTKLTYSAANNPIWIIRNNEVIVLSPDKIPVGKYDRDSVSFTQSEFDLNKGDMIYTLTDGFPDQFGGPNGKKFMYKKLKDTLISISNKKLPEQKDILHNTLTEWMGNVEQVDDITVIGIRI